VYSGELNIVVYEKIQISCLSHDRVGVQARNVDAGIGVQAGLDVYGVGQATGNLGVKPRDRVEGNVTIPPLSSETGKSDFHRTRLLNVQSLCQ
jgi:hypothetical protein